MARRTLLIAVVMVAVLILAGCGWLGITRQGGAGSGNDEAQGRLVSLNSSRWQAA